MTIRIAVLGNSHTAALKIAWDRDRASWRDIELTFFASRASPDTRLTHLRPEGGKLVATQPLMQERLRLTSGGQSSIDGSLYDAFAVMGQAPGPIPLPPASAFSAAVRALQYEAALERGFARLVANLRAIAPDKPIFAAAIPFPADPPADVAASTDLYPRSLDLMQRKVYGPLGVVVLPQPDETVVGDCWTRPEYCISAAQLDAETDPDERADLEQGDVTHMNALYGALVLAQLANAARRHVG